MKKKVMMVIAAYLVLYIIVFSANSFFDFDKVYFDGRVYHKSNFGSMSGHTRAEKFGDSLTPSWSLLIGIPIFISTNAKASPYVPTVIFMKKIGDRYVSYALSGGP